MKYRYLYSWMLLLTALLAFTSVKATLVPPKPVCSAFNPNGALDIANCELVSGWALDQADMNQTVTVDIYVDGNLVGSTQANTDRQDLVGAFGNSAARYHGFSYNVPANASWRNGQGHSIAVRIRGVSTDVTSSPKAVNGCSGGTTNPTTDPPTNPQNPTTSVLNPNGALDIANCELISGWALDQANMNQTVTVDIYVDGNLVGSTQANTDRQDLVGAFGNSAARYHGFSYNVPANASWRNGQGHSIAVRIRGVSTDVTSSPKAVNGCSGGTTNPTNPTNPTTNPTSNDFTGSLDIVNCDNISGWILNRNAPNQSVKYDVYVNGWRVASNVLAKGNRQDVANANGISGYNAFGFNVYLPSTYKAGVVLTISVTYAGTNINIPGSPKQTVTCNYVNGNTSPYAVNPDCYTQVARFFPGSGQARSAAVAHTDSTSLLLSTKGSKSLSLLTSKLIPIKQGDELSLDVYAYAPVLLKHNFTPQITAAAIGGVLTGVALAQQQAGNIDQRNTARVVPTIGVGTALMIPLVKSLLADRLPNAMLELAFYTKQGKFVHRQQVKLDETTRDGWQLLHIQGYAIKDGYAVVRLRNRSQSPVYFDDLFFQATHAGQISAFSGEFALTKINHSKSGFAPQVVVNDESIYQVNSGDCGGGSTGGAIVDDGIKFIDPGANVTATGPYYDLTGGGNFGSIGGGSTNSPPGQNMTDTFQRQLEISKQHFCQQLAQIRAKYNRAPNWDPANGTDAALESELLLAFINDVKGGATYDLKTHGYGEGNIGFVSNYNGGTLRYDDYGNINFGLAAAATGIPLSIALCGAGLYQIVSLTVDFRSLGVCLDAGRDSAMIAFGYTMFKGCDNPVGYGGN